MIVFPNKYPYTITNTTGGTVCGISPAGTKKLGPNYMEATYAFYASYAELAYDNLLSGSLTAVDANGVSLTASLAAASFTNMRSAVMDYNQGSRVYQPYTRFGDPIFVPGFFDEYGSTGALGQTLVLGSSGMAWSSVSGATGSSGNYAYYTQFTSASLASGSINITHNLNSEWVTVEVYDEDFKKIIPSEVQKLTNNTVSVSLVGLSVNGSWTAVVLAAGGSPAGGATGIQGTTGHQGIQGTTGTQGIQGIQGTTGVRGVTGSNGQVGVTGVQGVTGPSGSSIGALGINIDNGSSAVTAGVKKSFVIVPYACTITGWSAYTSGSAGYVSLSILRTSYASFPPTTANNICGTSYINLSNSDKNQSTTGWDTGWTKTLSAGDVLGIEIMSSPTPSVNNLSVSINITKA